MRKLAFTSLALIAAIGGLILFFDPFDGTGASAAGVPVTVAGFSYDAATQKASWTITLEGAPKDRINVLIDPIGHPPTTVNLDSNTNCSVPPAVAKRARTELQKPTALTCTIPDSGSLSTSITLQATAVLEIQCRNWNFETPTIIVASNGSRQVVRPSSAISDAKGKAGPQVIAGDSVKCKAPAPSVPRGRPR